MQTSDTPNEPSSEVVCYGEWRPDVPGCYVTPVGVEFTKDMDFAQWVAYGRMLCKVSRSLPWWIGDWLAFGRKLFCDRDQATGKFIAGSGTRRYESAMERTGIDGQTLANYCYVSSSIPIAMRRDPKELSWSHHREVAPLKPKEIDTWLGRAEKNEWSVSELRQALRRSQAEELQDQDLEPVPINLSRVVTDFGRVLRKLEGDVTSWPADRRRLVKQDLGNHIAAAQDFYNRL